MKKKGSGYQIRALVCGLLIKERLSERQSPPFDGLGAAWRSFRWGREMVPLMTNLRKGRTFHQLHISNLTDRLSGEINGSRRDESPLIQVTT